MRRMSNGVLGLAAALLIGAASLPASAVAQTNLRLSHVQDVNDPMHKAAELFAEKLAEYSDGDLTVTIHPAAQLGDYDQLQEMVQQRAIDIVVESIGTLSPFHPAAGVESMPFLFDSADHYVAVWNGPVGQEIKAGLAEDANFHIMGHMFRGTRELTTNRRVETIDDLAGLRIRVSPMREREVTWQKFGANPTPMGWTEVFTALQRGVIDGQENPLSTIVNGSIHQVQDYLIRTSHMANGWTFQWNAQRYAEFDEAERAAIERATDDAVAWYNDMIEAEEARLLEILSQEMEIIEVDRDSFRAKIPEILAEFPEFTEWYERIRAAPAS